jgi:hypothetical protein
MALTFTLIEAHSNGDQWKKSCNMALDTSYPQVLGGYYLDPKVFGMNIIEDVEIEDKKLFFDYVKDTGRFKVYAGSGSSHTHAVGTLDTGNESTHVHAVTAQATDSVSGGTPAGTINKVNIDIAVPEFTGTGVTAVAQVMTTTDNQTMGLNQCAGMWIYPVTGATPPVLILSNTAVTGAPAVFTVQGVAFTDAGAYYVVGNQPPAFMGAALAGHTHSTTGTTDAGAAHKHTVSGSVAASGGAAGAVEFTDGANLSTYTEISVNVYGR